MNKLTGKSLADQLITMLGYDTHNIQGMHRDLTREGMTDLSDPETVDMIILSRYMQKHAF